MTGLPSDTAVLRSVVAGDGGDPDRVRSTTIGFEAVRALLARRIDAATAFWSVEGVALKERRPGMREFRVDDFGAPAYPELVLVATRQTLEERPALVRATMRALQRGYTQTQFEPESAVAAMLEAERGLERAALTAQLDAVGPAFTAGARAYGELRPEVLRRWAAWDAALRDPRRPHRRRPGVRLLVRRARQEPVRRSTSAAPSRAIRERGTTRSNPAASARRRVSASTCE